MRDPGEVQAGQPVTEQKVKHLELCPQMSAFLEMDNQEKTTLTLTQETDGCDKNTHQMLKIYFCVG